jgi:hypothetical protein
MFIHKMRALDSTVCFGQPPVTALSPFGGVTRGEAHAQGSRGWVLGLIAGAY